MLYAVAQGVTSMVRMGACEDLEVFRRAHDAGRMITRIDAAVPLASCRRLRDEVEAHGRGDTWLAIGALKGFVDGSLGSRTAAFEAPYADPAGNRAFSSTGPRISTSGRQEPTAPPFRSSSMPAATARSTCSSTSSSASPARTAPATAASASSTPSTSLPPTSPGSPRWRRR
jgi:hypothetical protein